MSKLRLCCEHLFLALNLSKILLELFLLLLETLLFCKGSSASASRIYLILNFFLFLFQFGLKSRLFRLLSLPHGQARFLKLDLLHLL